MTDHDESPEIEANAPSDIDAFVERLRTSPYYQYVRPLRGLVAGKRILATQAGHAGFLLRLEDGTWVLSFLEGAQLAWQVGEGDPAGAELGLMQSSNFGDGGAPLGANLPYASEHCDIVGEVAKATGEVISGLSYGFNTFNFAFPDGHELETSIVRAADGKLALRVFWEQW